MDSQELNREQIACIKYVLFPGEWGNSLHGGVNACMEFIARLVRVHACVELIG